MLGCRLGIGMRPPIRGKSQPRGRFPSEIWTAGDAQWSQLSRKEWIRGLYAASYRQSHSVQARVSNRSKGPSPRPAPPHLERVGDLTGRLLTDYLSGWTTQYTEYDYYVPPDAVYGTVPQEIRGTLFLIGPALIDAYGTSVRHPLDADGMVCSLAFGDGGQIFFRNRYVRTPSFVVEQAVGRRLTRGHHDRGAPLAQRQQEQQEGHMQQQQHTPSPHQRQHKKHKQNQHSSGRQAPRKSHADGRAAAARTEFDDDDGDDDDDDDSRHEQVAASAAAAAAAVRRATMRTAVPLAATAVGQAAPHIQLPRFDPFALFGLQQPPPLSALFNPLDFSFRAPANASVVLWAGRLLAFTEGGSLPYELNKLSLETVGQYDVAGAMADFGRLVGRYKIAKPPAAAVGSSKSYTTAAAANTNTTATAAASERPQRLVLMGAAQSGPDVLLRWVEVGEDGALAGPATTYRMSGALAQGVVDFWVTDRYYVAVQAPLDFNLERFATEATLGTASFTECFEWDGGRPSRIHLVPRTAVAATVTTPAAAASVASSRAATIAAAGRRSGGAADADRCGGGGGSRGHGIRLGIGIGGEPFVRPPKGPEPIVVDAPPLLPVSCVGCYSLMPYGEDRKDVLVLDAICQQGLPGTGGGALDTVDLDEHWRQPKPELTRLVVDLQYGTASAKVLSQRTVSAATVAAAAAGGPFLVPVGHGNGGGDSTAYHKLYAAAAASDISEGWAPPQVLLKLALPPDHAVPAAAAEGGSSISGGRGCSSEGRWRGTGAEVWCPGSRVCMGPPVFVPRKDQRERVAPSETATSADGKSAVVSGGGDGGGGSVGGDGNSAVSWKVAPDAELRPHGASKPPSMGTEPAAATAATATAMAAARMREDEQNGWLLVMLHDAEAMTAELCVLDARDVTRGPVAVVRLPHHLPYARAAHFTRSYCGPGLAAPPGWRPRNAASVGAAVK